MKNIQLCSAALIIFLSNSAFATTTAKNNCTADEQILFSCAAKKKILSYCVSPHRAKNPYVEYRFTAPGKEKFTYRSDSNTSKTRFERASILGASASSTVIWFKNHGYTYVLNDPTKGSPYLEVLKNKKSVSRIVCDSEFSGNTDLESKLINEGSSEDFFRLTE